MNPKSLLLRSVSGLVYIALIIGAILWGERPLTCLAALFAAVATVEFEKITKSLSQNTVPALLLDVAGCVCLSAMWMVWPAAIWIFILICRLVLELYLKSEKPIRDLAISFFAQLYIGLPLGLMTSIGSTYGCMLVLAVFLFIWINDTGAFIVGSTCGRNRLFERISPKKSWEGFFGGLVLNLLAAWLFSIRFDDFFGFHEGTAAWLGLAAVVTVFGTWGDLVESMFKRSLSIKDSGNIIPGHGGILDRIDSLLLVMPAAFVYLLILMLV